MIAILLAAASAVTPLQWEGTAVVYDGTEKIPLTVRSRVEADGTVVSRSWPTAVGEAKGLHELVLRPDGSGTMQIGTRTQDAPAALVREEVAQFGFYQQLQEAVRWCDGEAVGSDTVKAFDGPVTTSFRCMNRRVTNAVNLVAAEGPPVRQDFRIVGVLRDGKGVFARRLSIKRDGKPFFDLNVSRFRSR